MRRGVVRIGQQPGDFDLDQALSEQPDRPRTPFENEKIAEARRLQRELADKQALQSALRLVSIALTAVAGVVAGPGGAALAGVFGSSLVAALVVGATGVLWEAIAAALLDRNVAAAILAETVVQAGKITAKYDDERVLRSIGKQIPPGLVDEARSLAILDSAQRHADRQFTSLVPFFAKAYMDPGNAINQAIQNAEGLLLTQGVPLIDTLRKAGVTPENLARGGGPGGSLQFVPTSYPRQAREDVMAFALNAGLNRYLYRSEWFRPTDGQFETDPFELERLRAIAIQQKADPESLALLNQRIAEYPIRAGESQDWRLVGVTREEYPAYLEWARRQPEGRVYPPDVYDGVRLIETGVARAFRAEEAGADDLRACQALPSLERCQPKPGAGGSRPSDPLFEPGGIFGARASDLQTTPLRMVASGAVATAPLWVPVLLLPWLRGRGRLRA